MRKLTKVMAPFAVALALVAVAGCGNDDDAGSDDVTVELAEVDGSGQEGTATLTASGDQTTVTIEITDPVSDSQPAHIHEGNCGDDLNPTPAFGLPNVASGTSTTTVDVSLQDLQDSDYAINLHMSDDDLETYTSCGNID